MLTLNTNGGTCSLSVTQNLFQYQKRPPGALKWPKGYKKGSNHRLLGVPNTFYNATPPAKYKIFAKGPQNGRQGLERYP